MSKWSVNLNFSMSAATWIISWFYFVNKIALLMLLEVVICIIKRACAPEKSAKSYRLTNFSRTLTIMVSLSFNFN